MPCPPIKFSEYSVRPYTSAGALGADTDRVFSELGYSREEIDNMRKSGAIK
jgi:crotonobetainyl-CoA:carnitine CoA-transferase CaiB-like acyl-CoA transferase